MAGPPLLGALRHLQAHPVRVPHPSPTGAREAAASPMLRACHGCTPPPHCRLRWPSSPHIQLPACCPPACLPVGPAESEGHFHAERLGAPQRRRWRGSAGSTPHCSHCGRPAGVPGSCPANRLPSQAQPCHMNPPLLLLLAVQVQLFQPGCGLMPHGLFCLLALPALPACSWRRPRPSWQW